MDNRTIRLRAWVAVLAVWPGLLVAAQQNGVVDLAFVLPVYCLLCEVIIVLAGWWRRQSTLALFAAPTAVFLILRLIAIDVSPMGGLLTLVTEIVAICITALLSRRAGQGIEEFESAVERSLAEELPIAVVPIEESQEEIHSELQRARRFGRPVTLMSIAAAEMGTEAGTELTERVQWTGLGRYIRARVAGLLSDRMREYDILATRGNHFVSLLPETSSEQAEEFIDRLRTACREALGIELRIGASSFPDEELTFDKLLERAEAEMRGARRSRIRSVALQADSSKLAG